MNKLHLRQVPTRVHVRSHHVLSASVPGNPAGHAIKYTGRGSLPIGCRRRGDRIIVEIIETTCGLKHSRSD